MEFKTLQVLTPANFFDLIYTTSDGILDLLHLSISEV